MIYDYRNGNYLFKHSIDERPSIVQASFQEHYHTAYEMLYFLKGDAEFVIQHSSYALSPHALLIVKPGEYHNLRMRTQKEYERVVIRFEEGDLPAELRERLPGLFNVYSIKNTPLSEELLQIDSYMQEIKGDDLLKALLTGQLSVILSLLCYHSEVYRQGVDHVNTEMRETIGYIRSHLSEIQSVEDVCAGMHTSRSSLQKLFNDQIHSPVMSYVRTQQCIAANHLMARGVPAAEAAGQCGFEHYSTFYRSYMRVFHRPPSATTPE